MATGNCMKIAVGRNLSAANLGSFPEIHLYHIQPDQTLNVNKFINI